MSFVLDTSSYGSLFREKLRSKIKFIKTYLRSTMCQMLLNSLALLSIERQRLNDLNADELIDILDDAKACKKPL